MNEYVSILKDAIVDMLNDYGILMDEDDTGLVRLDDFYAAMSYENDDGKVCLRVCLEDRDFDTIEVYEISNKHVAGALAKEICQKAGLIL